MRDAFFWGNGYNRLNWSRMRVGRKGAVAFPEFSSLHTRRADSEFILGKRRISAIRTQHDLYPRSKKSVRPRTRESR